MNNFPENIRSRLHFEAFDYISTELKVMITSDALKFITVQSFGTLEKDVLYLEAFVQKMESAGKSDSFNCSDAFTELRQLVGYVKNPDNYEDLLNGAIRQKKYNRVESADVFSIFEKLKNFDTGYFSKATPAEKQNKKLIENVLKSLK